MDGVLCNFVKAYLNDLEKCPTQKYPQSQFGFYIKLEEIPGAVEAFKILEKHFEVYGRMLDNHQLRQQILPMLETAGLIVQEQDPNDKRKMMIFPSSFYHLSETKRNSETDSGVKSDHTETENIISNNIDF